MASRKTSIKRHLDYLYARRSGAEFCLDLVRKEGDPVERINRFIHNLSTSIQENAAELSTIEAGEEREKEIKKQAKLEALRKRVGY